MTTRRKSQRKRAPTAGNTPGSVRIIGGEWRGRRLPVPDAPGLRPSGDRVRETLFNWLQPHLHGARCADLFAGTGVLGFEAASRGASEVILVERSGPLAAMLRESAALLNAGQVAVVHADALEWLQRRPGRSLDVVFIDPPFETELARRALEALVESACLAPGALVYVESPRLETSGAGPGLETSGAPPGGLREERQKVLGDVRIGLFSWHPDI